MKTFSAAAAVCAALFTGLSIMPAQSQETIRMTAASGLPEASSGTAQFANFFIPEVNRRLAETGKYKIQWTTGWGGSIAGQFDLFEAIQDGIADIGYVNTLFEGAKLPLEQITYVTPFGSSDLEKVIKTFNKLRTRVPELDATFLKYNQRRLAVVGLADYSILTTFDMKSVDDIKGKKIAAPGLAGNWLDGTGATPVSGSLSEYYNSLKTGVYDGIVVFDSGIGPFKFYEVAPHITRVGFGSMLASNLTINEDKWKSLPKDVQKVLTDVAAQYEGLVYKTTIDLTAKSLKTASDHGATVTEFSNADRKAYAAKLPNIAKQWAAALDSKGVKATAFLDAYMNLARQEGITFARDWDKE